MIPCDVTACRGDYKRTVLWFLRVVNVDPLESVDRLRSPLECESLHGVLSAVSYWTQKNSFFSVTFCKS
ncbi:hypothetical protein AVEN_100571-1, partial [Araneus ventricosus]